jgi:hypothetical protein
MSNLFKFPTSSYVKYDGFELFDARNTASVRGAVEKPELKQNCNGSAAPKAPPVPLRDDHIVLLAIDGLLALHTAFKKWRNHQRTLRVLAELDEHQLRDIGLTRDALMLTDVRSDGSWER